jgi:hypothetical protein
VPPTSDKAPPDPLGRDVDAPADKGSAWPVVHRAEERTPWPLLTLVKSSGSSMGSGPESPVRTRLLAGGRRIRTRGPPRRERLWGATPGKHCRLGPEPVSGSALRTAVSDWQRPDEPFAGAEPMVRIRFPPAESPSLSRSCFRVSGTPAFRAAVRRWLADRVSRDAQGVSRSRQPAAISLSRHTPVPQCR